MYQKLKYGLSKNSKLDKNCIEDISILLNI